MFTAGQGGMGTSGAGHDLISSCSSMSYSDYEDEDQDQMNEEASIAQPSLVGAQSMNAMGTGEEPTVWLPKAPYTMQGVNHLRLLLAERSHLGWIKYTKGSENDNKLAEDERKDEFKEMEVSHHSPVRVPGEDIEMKE